VSAQKVIFCSTFNYDIYIYNLRANTWYQNFDHLSDIYGVQLRILEVSIRVAVGIIVYD
jgi:hypothetical protein